MSKQTAIPKQQDPQVLAVMNAIMIQTGQSTSRRDITWGIVEAFRNWQLQQGLAIGSINRRLSTVRMYAKFDANGRRQVGVYMCASGRDGVFYTTHKPR